MVGLWTLLFWTFGSRRKFSRGTQGKVFWASPKVLFYLVIVPFYLQLFLPNFPLSHTWGSLLQPHASTDSGDFRWHRVTSVDWFQWYRKTEKMAQKHKSRRHGIKIMCLEHRKPAHLLFHLSIRWRGEFPNTQELCSCVARVLLNSAVSFCNVCPWDWWQGREYVHVFPEPFPLHDYITSDVSDLCFCPFIASSVMDRLITRKEGISLRENVVLVSSRFYL